MSIHDPVPDMLTRIRNAGMMRHAEVTMPATKLLVQIARILREEGYVLDYQRDRARRRRTSSLCA